MKKIIFAEWIIAAGILAVLIIQVAEFEPHLVNKLADWANAIIQRFS